MRISHPGDPNQELHSIAGVQRPWAPVRALTEWRKMVPVPVRVQISMMWFVSCSNYMLGWEGELPWPLPGLPLLLTRSTNPFIEEMTEHTRRLQGFCWISSCPNFSGFLLEAPWNWGAHMEKMRPGSTTTGCRGSPLLARLPVLCYLAIELAL